MGAPARAAGTLTASLYVNSERRGGVTRALRKESWKLESERISQFAVSPTLVAYDTKDGVLLIGLLRLERAGLPIALHKLTLRLPDAGTWEWPTLTSDFRVPARPAGRIR